MPQWPASLVCELRVPRYVWRQRCSSVICVCNGLASSVLTTLAVDSPQVKASKRFQILIRDIILPLGNKLNESSRRVRWWRHVHGAVLSSASRLARISHSQLSRH